MKKKKITVEFIKDFPFLLGDPDFETGLKCTIKAGEIDEIFICPKCPNYHLVKKIYPRLGTIPKESLSEFCKIIEK